MLELTLHHLDGCPGRIGISVPFRIRQQREEVVVTSGEVAVRLDIEDSSGALLELGQLVVGQKRLPFERLRPLERRRAAVPPDALEVRLTVYRARSVPALAGSPLPLSMGRLGLRGHRRNDEHAREKRKPHCCYLASARSSARVPWRMLRSP